MEIAQMPQSQSALSNQVSKLPTVITEVPSRVNVSFDLNNPIVPKLLEEGGFIAFLLALCLLFWTLTRFVEALKKD
jgi:hypothetical protein